MTLMGTELEWRRDAAGADARVGEAFVDLGGTFLHVFASGETPEFPVQAERLVQTLRHEVRPMVPGAAQCLPRRLVRFLYSTSFHSRKSGV